MIQMAGILACSPLLLHMQEKKSFTNLLERDGESEQKGECGAEVCCGGVPKFSDLQFLQHWVVGQSLNEVG